MMARRAGTSRWLIALADPEGAEHPLPVKPLPVGAAKELLDLADRHGVLPAIFENLTAVMREHGPDMAFASANGARADLDGVLSRAKAALLARASLTMALRVQLREIIAALAVKHLPAVVLKGADFADRLYPRPHLRPFTDIDVLVPREAFADAARLMADLGYSPGKMSMKHADGYGERSWRRPDKPGGAVEVHWNLVNSPAVRRGVSVGYEDLALLPPDGDQRLPRPTAASMLLIAAVHGATSHAFDRLGLLCDIRQAARGRAGAIDCAWLAEAHASTGASLALSVALDLAGRLLADESCAALRRRLSLPAPNPICRMLLTRGVVLRSHAKADSFRRQLFRSMLKRSGR